MDRTWMIGFRRKKKFCEPERKLSTKHPGSLFRRATLPRANECFPRAQESTAIRDEARPVRHPCAPAGGIACRRHCGRFGGIIGALVGMGIPEYEAKLYQGRIKEGGILLSVHADNSDWVRRAKDILKQTRAEEISSAPAALPSAAALL